MSTQSHCVLGLAANKVDIMFKQQELREVLREQAELLAKNQDMVFVEECSAKTGQLVNETFMALVETVYGVQMGLVE